MLLSGCGRSAVSLHTFFSVEAPCSVASSSSNRAGRIQSCVKGLRLDQGDRDPGMLSRADLEAEANGVMSL